MSENEHSFERIALGDLAAMDDAERDALPYGVIGFDAETVVHSYNLTESRMAGLDPSTVMGKHYFEVVAQCMNNFMVSQRFEDEAEIDDILPYVLTLRMRPTKVRLRLLKSPGAALRYVLIER